jgi:NAD(P)-dependent dehydrogenase (short-subunit alcohol dehydrogenase family)
LQSARCGSRQRFGRLDILVNNAGIGIVKQPQEYTLAEWNTVLATNLSSAFLCAQAAYPEMLRAGGGKVINIGSMTSIFGAAFAASYAASKGGIVQLSKSLATAWAKDNIQVNAVLPGWIDTDLTRGARAELSGLHEGVLARTPAGRWGTPTTSLASLSSWPARHRISSPAPRSLWTADIRCRRKGAIDKASAVAAAASTMSASRLLRRRVHKPERDRR